MKTSLLVSAVIAAHCVAVGSAFLIQGCGTTRGPVELPTETPMPPTIEEEPVKPDIPIVPVKPALAAPAAPEAKSWPVDETTTYVVAKGDTLSQIARRYGLTVAEIMTLNGISNPNAIRIGQKLVLPGKIDINKPAKPAAKKTAAKKLPPGANAYTVQPGDCLSVIASRAGVTTKALREANGLKGDTIYVGQKLAIPGGKKVTPKKPSAPAKPAPSPVAPAPSVPVAPEPPAGFDVPELPEAAEEPLPVADLPPELPTPTESATVYTVRAGDDILTVASEHNVSIADLRRVNRLTSDLLVPGQKLVIPTQD